MDGYIENRSKLSGCSVCLSARGTQQREQSARRWGRGPISRAKSGSRGTRADQGVCPTKRQAAGRTPARTPAWQAGGPLHETEMM
jgi:hypothetical protein